MGTKSAFGKAIRELFRGLSAQELDNVLRIIDGSYVLHAITRQRNLGFDMFTVNPRSPLHVDLLAKRAVDVMLEFLKPLKITPENSAIFFEGRILKPRHDSYNKKRSGRISDSIRIINCRYAEKSLKFAGRRRKRAKRAISSTYGRPPAFITIAIADEFTRRKFFADYHETIESDFRICELAAAWKSGEAIVVANGDSEIPILFANSLKRTMVVGSDSDFIALSPPGSVDQISKINHGTAVTVEKEAVKNELDLDDLKLFLAFSIAGCCNVPSHVNGIGWVKASQFAKDAGITLDSIETIDEIPLKTGDKMIKQKMASEIRAALSNFGWRSVGTRRFSGVPNAHLPKMSEIEEFASETLDGFLVRPAIYRMVFRREPDKSLVRCQPITEHRPVVKGTKSPRYPMARKIPANQFFVLTDFQDMTANSFEQGLHLSPEDYKKWLKEKAVVNNHNHESAEIESEHEAVSTGTSEGNTKPKGKKKKRGNGKKNDRETAKKPKNSTAEKSRISKTESDQQKPRRSARLAAIPTVTTGLESESVSSCQDNAVPIVTIKASEQQQKEQQQKKKQYRPKKPTASRKGYQKIAEGRKSRVKASAAARRGEVDAGNGEATVPMADRKRLNATYKTFAIRVGSLKKSVKNAVKHLNVENKTQLVSVRSLIWYIMQLIGP